MRDDKAPPLADNEEARLAALRDYAILDTPGEGAFDDITRLAALICATPIAVVNFVDRGRQWFKSEIGLGVRETPLGPSICAHAILQTDLFVVPDTTADARFSANPLVTGDPRLRFYAGAPLLTADGLPLGTVCVLDVAPRELDEGQKAALKALARQTMAQLELRRALAAAQRSSAFRGQLMAVVGHDLKTPLRSASYAVSRLKRSSPPPAAEPLAAVGEALAQIDRELDKLVALATSGDEAGPLALTVFPLADVLDPLVEQWRKVAARKGLALRYVRSTLRVRSQPALLATLLGNLLGNAVKYTARGSVLVGCRRRGERTDVQVVDTGIGIRDDRRSTVFDAFRQLDPGSEGLGLGLWIVSRSASLLDHPLTLQSREGRGSCFSLSVPRAD